MPALYGRGVGSAQRQEYRRETGENENALFMTDANFKSLVAETMEYVHASRKIPKKLWDRWPKGCRDCGCSEPEFYMANQDVWIKANRIGTAHGVLCLSCFEKRLGQPLRDSDIPGGITDEYDEGVTVSEWRERRLSPSEHHV